MQIRAQLQYKLNVLIDIVTYFAVTCLEFTAILLFFGPFPTLLGWKIGEVAWLVTIVTTSFGLAELVGAGIDNFPETIRRGEFDRVLLRPVGVFLQIIGSDFRLRRLGRLTQGVFVAIVALSLLPGLHWTSLKILVLAIGVVSTSVIFLSILLLGATICFWSVETTELTSLLYHGGREMLMYPISAYHGLMQRFFLFVVPLAFGAYIPACYILDRPLPLGLPTDVVFMAPLVSLIFALVAGFIWGFGVRHYQSTGS